MVLGWGEILVVVGEIHCALKSWCQRSHRRWMNLSCLSLILRSLTLQWSAARSLGGNDVVEWAATLEDVPSDFWAELTIVREVMDWDFHFPRSVV